MERSVDPGSSANFEVGVIPFAVMQRHTGLEVLHQLKRGLLPRPPVSEVIPFELMDIEFGKATLISTPSETFYNTLGIVHGSYAMTLLDSCMALAIYAPPGPGIGYTTIETKVNFVKPVTGDPGQLRPLAKAGAIKTRTEPSEG